MGRHHANKLPGCSCGWALHLLPSLDTCIPDPLSSVVVFLLCNLLLFLTCPLVKSYSYLLPFITLIQHTQQPLPTGAVTPPIYIIQSPALPSRFASTINFDLLGLFFFFSISTSIPFTLSLVSCFVSLCTLHPPHLSNKNNGPAASINTTS